MAIISASYPLPAISGITSNVGHDPSGNFEITAPEPLSKNLDVERNPYRQALSGEAVIVAFCKVTQLLYFQVFADKYIGFDKG